MKNLLNKILLCLLIILGLSVSVFARTIRIAVIDTGYNTLDYHFKLCSPEEQYNFVLGQTIQDDIGHGQNIMHIIDMYASDYCIIPIKVISKLQIVNEENIIAALKMLESTKVDIINMSYGGAGRNNQEEQEISTLQNQGVIIVAAAGNERMDLDKHCDYFPACYNKRIITVGNLDEYKEKSYKSNYGKYVSIWEVGTNITAGGYTMSGTSQATAIVTGKLARHLANKYSKIGK